MVRRITTVITLVGTLTALAMSQARPRDPFVFRTAITENNIDLTSGRPSANKNRLVAVLLNSNFTALYSTQNGSLYEARNGVANDGNTTYDQTVFGQCLTFEGGAILHKNSAPQMWSLLTSGAPVTSKTVYKGFSLAGTVVTLRYAIVAGATTINISEVPEFVAGGTGGMRRAITVSGLGANQSVRLQINGSVAPETWTSQGGGTISGTDPMYLTITANGTATITGSWN